MSNQMFNISERAITDHDDDFFDAMLRQQTEIHSKLMIKSNNDTLIKIMNGSYEPVICLPEDKQELDRLKNEFLKCLHYEKKSPIVYDSVKRPSNIH